MSITSERVYTTLLNLIREDARGLMLSVDEYNRLSRVVNQRIFAIKYEKFETDTDNISTLAGFKEIDVPLVLVAATTSLPANYRDMIGKPRIVNTAGSTRRCDLVSQLELDERTEDYLTKPTETYPVYTLGEFDNSGNVVLHVYPTTITGNITIDYLRDALVPYLDWYMNTTTFVLSYMGDGDVTVIPVGYTYRDGTAGDGVTPTNSISQDWEWSEDDMPLILSLFCQMLGIAIPDTFLSQVGNLEEQKNS